MLCSRSGVDSHKLRRGLLARQDRDRLAYAVGELSQGNIFIDDSPGLTLMDLRTKGRRLKLQYGIELIVIDYLQLMEAPREETASSRSVPSAAASRPWPASLTCPSFALAAQSRLGIRAAPAAHQRPAGIRFIEQDADVVVLLHREAVMHRGDQEWADANPDKINEALLIIAKQRNGPCDNVKLTFLSSNTRFVTYNPGV